MKSLPSGLHLQVAKLLKLGALHLFSIQLRLKIYDNNTARFHVSYCDRGKYLLLDPVKYVVTVVAIVRFNEFHLPFNCWNTAVVSVVTS